MNIFEGKAGAVSGLGFIASVVLFLCSDAASMVVGHSLSGYSLCQTRSTRKPINNKMQIYTQQAMDKSAVTRCFLLNTIMMNAQTPAHETTLTAPQQSIVGISAATATGNLTLLRSELAKGLDAGLTINEAKELLVQLYAYCGFPRSLNGINTLMAVLDERRAKGITDAEGRAASPISEGDKYQAGKRTLQTLTGREEKALAGANAFAPAIDTFLKEHLFADIFSRDVLTFQQRELVTVAALAAMDGVVPQLQAHIGIAMNTGITPPSLQATFSIIDRLIGNNAGDIARSALEKVLSAQQL